MNKYIYCDNVHAKIVLMIDEKMTILLDCYTLQTLFLFVQCSLLLLSFIPSEDNDDLDLLGLNTVCILSSSHASRFLAMKSIVL